MKEPYSEISFAVPYRLPLEEQEYDGVFRFKGATLSFSLEVSHQYVYDKRTEELLGMKAGGTGQWTVFDKFGASHISRVTVKISDGLSGDDAKEAACAALNRLLDVVRLFTRDFRISHVRPQQDIFSFQVSTFDADRKGMQAFQFGGQSKIVYPVQVRDFSDVEAEILAMLKEDAPVPLHDVYRQEARRHFEERDFAVAVILMNAALELLWAELLRYGLSQRGEEDEAITRQMNQWLGSRKTLPTLDKASKDVTGRTMKEDAPGLWERLEKA